MSITAKNEKAVDQRIKNFLTETEMTQFLAAARKGRHGVRDYLLVLMAYRHGLRVSELTNLRTSDLDLDAGRLFVR
jgi:integrase